MRGAANPLWGESQRADEVERGQQTFSVKNQRVNTLGLWAILPLSQLLSPSLFNGKSSHGQYVNKHTAGSQ